MARLDQYLVNKGLVDSRNKAQTFIKDEKVTIDGKIVTKPSFKVEDNHNVELHVDKVYVSRAALKLKEFLVDYDISLEDKECIDIGSSTGGFTQILLENSVKSVTCIDVGSDQLHESLKSDSRVILHENCDIREYKSEKRFDILTCDVSFISILNIIDSMDRLANHDIIILFKPQFEVGIKAKRDKNGVVKDDKAVDMAIALFRKKAYSLGWKEIENIESKVLGKDGNRELFFHFQK
jgi:23S rRNA (cytidine1920-2'-O)/16S rRNA (cytidine1409-2'-O)-methyltransferase